MTLIAHGVLAVTNKHRKKQLAKAEAGLKDHDVKNLDTVNEYIDQADEELADIRKQLADTSLLEEAREELQDEYDEILKGRDKLLANKTALEKVADRKTRADHTSKQMEKLKSVEYDIACKNLAYLFAKADPFIPEGKANPAALESTILSYPVVLGTSPLWLSLVLILKARTKHDKKNTNKILDIIKTTEVLRLTSNNEQHVKFVIDNAYELVITKDEQSNVESVALHTFSNGRAGKTLARVHNEKRCKSIETAANEKYKAQQAKQQAKEVEAVEIRAEKAEEHQIEPFEQVVKYAVSIESEKGTADNEWFVKLVDDKNQAHLIWSIRNSKQRIMRLYPFGDQIKPDQEMAKIQSSRGCERVWQAIHAKETEIKETAQKVRILATISEKFVTKR